MEIKDIPLERFTELYFEQKTVEDLRAKGYSFEVYFDSDIIFSMIQGYWAFELPPEKAKIALQEDEVIHLVSSLAYYGKINGLKVFQPHLKEIKNFLDREYSFPLRQVPEKIIKTLFNEFEIVDISRYNLENKRELNYLSNIINRSRKFCKYYYILSEPNWVKRAERLVRGRDALFSRDSRTYDIPSLFTSDLFHRIYSQLSILREDRSINNLRDSLSLCMLNQCKDQNDKKVIPLFLAGSASFEYIFNDPDIASQFVVTRDGLSLNIIKPAEFFLFDVIFKTGVDQTENFFSHLRSFKKTKELEYEEHHPDDHEPIQSQKPTILNFVNNEFFDVFKSIINTVEFDFSNAIKKLKDLKEAVNDESLLLQFEQEKEVLLIQLAESTSEIALFERIWVAVEKIITKPTNFKVSRKDIFNDTTITRFSPSKEIGSELNKIWNALIHTKEGTLGERYQLHSRVADIVFKGIQNKDIKKLTLGCSLLWIFEQFSFINKILDDLHFEYDENISLALLHASSLCVDNAPSKKQSVNKIIDCIKSKPGFKANKYQVRIGLAYVHFRFWETEVLPHFIIDAHPTQDPFKEEIYPMALTAISLSKGVFNELETTKSDDPEKKEYRYSKLFYAKNIYIYYMTRAAKKETFLNRNLLGIVEAFQEQKNAFYGRYWQATFYHTLANFWARMYFLEENPSLKKLYIASAKRNYEDFIDGAVIHLNRFRHMGEYIDAEFLKA